MLTIKGLSSWSFVTSSSINASLFISVENGYIDFNDPNKVLNRFHYTAIGAGPSYSYKIGNGTLTSSLPNMPSVGDILMLGAFGGKELQRQDLTGWCLSAEISAAVFTGGSATAMLLGCEQRHLEDDAWAVLIEVGTLIGAGKGATDAEDRVVPYDLGFLGYSAKALLLMAGVSIGVQVGAGATASVGYLS